MSGLQAWDPIGSCSVKRKLRRAIEVALPLLGMGIIFGSVLFASPNNLQIQVLLVLFGVLILEAGVWGLTRALLPNERRYLALREEGDHFLGLIRVLNDAAIARDSGHESDARFRDTRARMHTSVDRMAQVAGQDAHDDAEASSGKPESNNEVNAPESSVAEETTRGMEEAHDAAAVGPEDAEDAEELAQEDAKAVAREDAEAISAQKAEEAVVD